MSIESPGASHLHDSRIGRAEALTIDEVHERDNEGSHPVQETGHQPVIVAEQDDSQVREPAVAGHPLQVGRSRFIGEDSRRGARPQDHHAGGVELPPR